MSQKENKVTNEPQVKDGMQVWLAKSIIEKELLWVLKRNKEKVLTYVKR